MGHNRLFTSSEFSTRPVQRNNEACLGCLMCRGKVTVTYDNWEALDGLTDAAAGLVPVTRPRQTDHSDCGIAAVDGICHNEDGREMVVEAIKAEELPGIKLVEGTY